MPERPAALRLKLPAVHGKQRRDGCRHLIGARGTTAVVRVVAAALAALGVEWIPAKSAAAVAIISGAASTYDMSFQLLNHRAERLTVIVLIPHLEVSGYRATQTRPKRQGGIK